jgi:signal transduction histidine kinase
MNPAGTTPWSLRTRLLLSLLGLTALLFGASAIQNVIAGRETSRRLFDDSLRESAGLLLQLARHEIAEHGPFLGIELLKAETQPGPYGFQFQIWTADMQAGYRSAQLTTTPLMPFEAEGFGWTEIRGEHWRTYTTWDDTRTLQIQIAQSQRQRQALDHSSLLRTGAGVLALLAVAGALIWWILALSFRPLQRTARSVGERSESDLRPVDGMDAPVEVQPLLEALNRLLGRIRTTLQFERRFTSDAAHELRTPLAAIRTNAQVLVGARDAAERDATAQDLISSVDRSTRLVEQLLSLARADAVLAARDVKVVDLAEIAREQVRAHGPLAERNGILLAEGSLGPATSLADPELVGVLLRNLLENALRYTPTGGRVAVATGSDEAGAWLEVLDDGPGISPDQRERVFERFYREAGQKSTGSGLGLSIVRRIVELHRGTVRLQEGEGGSGLRVRISLPGVGR